ncbi:type VI secretion protein VasK [Planctomycetota bacterium]|nr:type VI secretion protein VasK [Planctomycetota bacterium]
MKAIAFASAVVCALLVALYVLSFVIRMPTWIWALLVAVAVLIGVVAWLVRKLMDAGKAKTIERGVAAGASETAAMREQFQRYLTALRQSPSGRGALATLPWYLVIGAPGSGKTTMLQESGLAFSSLGHGLRSVRGIGGTRSCDWWFTDSAIFLDTAGRYTTQPEDQGEWFAFLDLVRTTRRDRALNGILVVVSIPDLVRDHEAAIATTVRPVRERIVEVCHRLGVVPPVYLVFTKADMMGGFKDFFAGLTRTERDQVWGATLAPAELAQRLAHEIYDQQVQRLVSGLEAKRMAALTGDRPQAALVKTLLFPANVTSSQRWFSALVGELFRPYPLPDQPMFRGFYYTSSIQPNRDTRQVAAMAQAAAAPPPPKTNNFEGSIFFAPSAVAAAQEADGAGNHGFFLRDLFAKVVIGDAGLAGRPRAVRQRLAIGRALVAYGSLAIAIAVALWLVVGSSTDAGLVTRTAAACRDLTHAGDADDELDALDHLRARLVEVRDHGSPTGGPAIAAEAHRVYFPALARHFIRPAAERLRAAIDSARTGLSSSPGGYDQLFELLRAYQMLCGEVPPDRGLLVRQLIDEPRLASAHAADAGKSSADPGKSSADPGKTGGDKPKAESDPAVPERIAAQAAAHLDYLVGVMEQSAGGNRPTDTWRAKSDKTLVDRVRAALGDNIWLQLGYSELITAAQAGMERLGRDALVAGENRELLVLDQDLSAVFGRDAYESVVESAISEKAGALVAKLGELKARPLSTSEVRRRLRTMYAKERLTRWLDLLTHVRPVAFPSVALTADRLRILTGPDSPYRSIPRQLAAQDADLADVDAVPSLPADATWMDNGLEAAKDLVAAAERFAAGTEVGGRVRDIAKLKELCTTCDQTAQRFATAVGVLDHEPVRRAAAACLGGLIDALHAALAGELANELERGWTGEVEQPFREQCAGRFPFDPEATAEVPPATFARIFNPKSGTFWRGLKSVEDLRAMKLAGRDLLPVSFDYQRALAQANLIREALFSDGGEELSIAFSATLIQREGVEDLILSVGDQKFAFYDRPDHKGSFRWKQSQPGGAKLSITLASNQLLTINQPGSGWGILRLLRSGKPLKRPEGGHLCQWSFEAKSLNRTFLAGAILDAPALETLVAGDLLKGFAIPARIGKADRTSERR